MKKLLTFVLLLSLTQNSFSAEQDPRIAQLNHALAQISIDNTHYIEKLQRNHDISFMLQMLAQPGMTKGSFKEMFALPAFDPSAQPAPRPMPTYLPAAHVHSSPAQGLPVAPKPTQNPIAVQPAPSFNPAHIPGAKPSVSNPIATTMFPKNDPVAHKLPYVPKTTIEAILNANARKQEEEKLQEEIKAYQAKVAQLVFPINDSTIQMPAGYPAINKVSSQKPASTESDPFDRVTLVPVDELFLDQEPFPIDEPKNLPEAPETPIFSFFYNPQDYSSYNIDAAPADDPVAPQFTEHLTPTAAPAAPIVIKPAQPAITKEEEELAKLAATLKTKESDPKQLMEQAKLTIRGRIPQEILENIDLTLEAKNLTQVRQNQINLVNMEVPIVRAGDAEIIAELKQVGQDHEQWGPLSQLCPDITELITTIVREHIDTHQELKTTILELQKTIPGGMSICAPHGSTTLRADKTISGSQRNMLRCLDSYRQLALIRSTLNLPPIPLRDIANHLLIEKNEEERTSEYNTFVTLPNQVIADYLKTIEKAPEANIKIIMNDPEQRREALELCEKWLKTRK